MKGLIENNLIELQMNSSVDPRRGDKINRFKPTSQGAGSDDLVPDYMNILGNVDPKIKLNET